MFWVKDYKGRKNWNGKGMPKGKQKEEGVRDQKRRECS